MPPKKGKKGTNAAPWWWGLGVAEGWAIGLKDTRKDKVYAEAVAQLDAAYGGANAAVVSKYTNWGTAGAHSHNECLTVCADCWWGRFIDE